MPGMPVTFRIGPPSAGTEIDRATVGAMVRLEVAVRDEKELPAVSGPGRLSLVERAARQSARLGCGIGGCVPWSGHGNRPEMGGMEAVAIARIIAAEFFVGDDPHIALSLRFFAFLDAPGLVDVFRGRPAQEGNGLAVGRPGRRRGPFGQFGQRSGLAPGKGKQKELGRLRLPVFLGGTSEDQPCSVGRPSRSGVARAVGQAPRLEVLSPGGNRNEPDRGQVIVLVRIDGDLDERDLGTIGCDPGVGRPCEPHQIIGGDRTLCSLRPGGYGQCECQPAESRQGDQISASIASHTMSPSRKDKSAGTPLARRLGLP